MFASEITLTQAEFVVVNILGGFLYSVAKIKVRSCHRHVLVNIGSPGLSGHSRNSKRLPLPVSRRKPRLGPEVR